MEKMKMWEERKNEKEKKENKKNQLWHLSQIFQQSYQLKVL